MATACSFSFLFVFVIISCFHFPLILVLFCLFFCSVLFCFVFPLCFLLFLFFFPFPDYLNFAPRVKCGVTSLSFIPTEISTQLNTKRILPIWKQIKRNSILNNNQSMVIMTFVSANLSYLISITAT